MTGNGVLRIGSPWEATRIKARPCIVNGGLSRCRLEQLPHLVVVGEVQRRAVVLVFDGDVGAVVEKQTHDVDVTAGNRVV